MEGLILIIFALGALGAFAAGVVLLFLYFRAGSSGSDYGDPEVYGSLIQCPRCGYMNPYDSPACLNCRQPLPHPRGYAAPPAPRPNYPSYQPPPAPRATPPPVADATAAAPARSAHTVSPAPATPGMPRAWLEGTAGAMLGHTAGLNKPDMLVGRSTSCDVQIYDPKVSRRHFMIRFANGGFFLQDQQSSRGTFVNGERVLAQRLSNGDRIQIGDTSLVFRSEGL